jgi:hypothetical protein
VLSWVCSSFSVSTASLAPSVVCSASRGVSTLAAMLSAGALSVLREEGGSGVGLDLALALAETMEALAATMGSVGVDSASSKVSCDQICQSNLLCDLFNGW